jgi:hypothetical protein
MAFNDALLSVGATAMQAAATHASIHTALPDGTGSNESTAGREVIPWDAVGGSGDMVVTTDIVFTGGAPSGPATYIGFWDGVGPGGTWYGFFALTGDLAFNAAGELTIAAGTVLGSST